VSTRILIADDQAVVRSGFRMMLEDEPDFEIVGEAHDGAEAIALVERRRADVVLMDIRMPGMDGLEATRRLAGPGVEQPAKVIVITTFDLDEYVFGALRAGAAGFLLKDTQPEVLIDAIRRVDQGFGLIAPEVTRRLIGEFAAVAPDPAEAQRLTVLSERERDVLLLMAKGRTNAQIGADLYLEETTIKTHVSAVLAKLGVNSRVQAVIAAYETGLVSPGQRPSGSAHPGDEGLPPPDERGNRPLNR
jgi:DNA-binding NarL/FixJ family response regulator